MPQMAPLYWIPLYIFFILSFLLMVILNYYSFLYQPKKFINTHFKTNFKWKW